VVSKERPRWEHKAIRDRFPLASERQQLPRFDDPYRCGKPPYTVEFNRDGTVLVGGEAGSWNVDEGATVHVTTPRWRCEGAIGIDDLYLRCALEGSPVADIQLALRLGPEIRRDDLRDVLRAGTVIWLHDRKGNGRIEADDGEWLWFHVGGTSDAWASLRVGDRVNFVWEGHAVDHGVHVAANVTRI
jgi:cold shock CspA family protein